MSNNFYPLPTSLPAAELLALAGIFRGNMPSSQDAFQATWVVVGYAEKQLTGLMSAGFVPVVGGAEDWTAEDWACQCEAEAGRVDGDDTMRGVFPWAALLQFALPILIDILKKRFGG